MTQAKNYELIQRAKPDRENFTLNPEQVQGLLHCTKGPRFQILQGAAGTGKSASLCRQDGLRG